MNHPYLGVTQGGDILTALEIDFERDSPDPGRVFRAMSELIDAFHEIDKALVQSLPVRIEPVLLLREVEAGSIRAHLRTILLQVDDEALRNLDWKPLVGQYLVKGKHWLLKRLDEIPEITSKGDVQQLQSGLLRLAEETDVAAIPAYEPIPPKQLLQDLARISDALANLHVGDRAIYISPEGDVTINQSFSISSEQIEELLTAEVFSGENVLRLMVKKPDYLGDSKWEFRYDGRAIDAKILDEAWLHRFQNREEDVRPGDALRARVLTEVKRGVDGSVVATHYWVLEVLEVIRSMDGQQQPLLPASEME